MNRDEKGLRSVSAEDLGMAGAYPLTTMGAMAMARPPGGPRMVQIPIVTAASLDRILVEGVLRYSQVWEDHRLVEEGLAIDANDDVLCIGSAGCNALNLLLRGPRSVVAVDMNPAQTAVVELKVAAIRSLEWEQFVGLLGITAHDDRLALYERLRPALSPTARTWWDSHETEVRDGLHWSGRLEGYFRGFQRTVLPLVHSPEMVARLLAQDDGEAQLRFFDEAFGTTAFEQAFRGYFTRERLASEGRDARQMRYVAAMDVSGYFYDRFRWVCTALPTRGNHYLESFLTSQHADVDSVAPYLRRANWETLRARIDRLTLVLGDIGEQLRTREVGALSKANLSDIFEYLSEEQADALFHLFAERLRPGGRLCFWNLLVPRGVPESLHARLIPKVGESRALWRQDRSWFYRDFHVAEKAT
jgi:S-adenosylmethionine-diacylglycerol 3-amino-3-carboxypropyl transferase